MTKESLIMVLDCAHLTPDKDEAEFEVTFNLYRGSNDTDDPSEISVLEIVEVETGRVFDDEDLKEQAINKYNDLDTRW